MRLQPPKNIDEFVGKDASDEEILSSYIGSHRLLYRDGEKTVREYLEDNDWFSDKHVQGFISIFPIEIQNLAKIYLDKNLLQLKKPIHK